MNRTPAGQRDSVMARGLRAALTNEIDGREFYRVAAANTGHDNVRRMFEFVMGEEERHRDVILDQLDRLAKSKPLKLAHLDILSKQYGQLREMYREVRFWPF